jgi:hypothetical protein
MYDDNTPGLLTVDSVELPGFMWRHDRDRVTIHRQQGNYSPSKELSNDHE